MRPETVVYHFNTQKEKKEEGKREKKKRKKEIEVVALAC